MTPKFTIITPTYNRADLIGETIESVLAQTVKDFEYLIIDDGSSDNTEQVVAEYMKRDSRVRYYKQENQGEPAAVNHGWQLAQGEYFLTVNSDDPVMPDLLEEMGKALDAHPEAILAFCDFVIVDENRKPIRTVYSSRGTLYDQLEGLDCGAVAPCTTLRRSMLSNWKTLRRKGYRHINDFEMYFNIMLEGDFVLVPKVLSCWRQHSGQISTNRYQAAIELDDWYKKFFSRPDISDEVRNCKYKCRETQLSYFRYLYCHSGLEAAELRTQYFKLERLLALEADSRFVALLVTDTDQPENGFSGYELQEPLRAQHVASYTYVAKHCGKARYTYLLPVSAERNYARQVMYGNQFSVADVVHLHRIENTNFNVESLPMLSTLKPTLLTLYDFFFLGGGCTDASGCDKYSSLCVDCPKLPEGRTSEEDAAPVEFMRRYVALRGSKLAVHVSTRWLEERVKRSPVFEGKAVYRVPMGVNQAVFAPADRQAAKRSLNINADDFVLLADDNAPAWDELAQALKSLGSVALTLLVSDEKTLPDTLKPLCTVRAYAGTDALTAMQAADAVLLTNSRDLTGRLAMEAMSCGAVALVSPDTALYEIAAAPECGVEVNAGGLADALRGLITDKAQLNARRDASLKYAQEHYSLEKYAQAIGEVYQKVMADYQGDERLPEVLAQLALHECTPAEYSAETSDEWITKYQWYRTQNEAYQSELTRVLGELSRIQGSRAYRLVKSLQDIKRRLSGGSKK